MPPIYSFLLPGQLGLLLWISFRLTRSSHAGLRTAEWAWLVSWLLEVLLLSCSSHQQLAYLQIKVSFATHYLRNLWLQNQGPGLISLQFYVISWVVPLLPASLTYLAVLEAPPPTPYS